MNKNFASPRKLLNPAALALVCNFHIRQKAGYWLITFVREPMRQLQIQASHWILVIERSDWFATHGLTNSSHSTGKDVFQVVEIITLFRQKRFSRLVNRDLNQRQRLHQAKRP